MMILAKVEGKAQCPQSYPRMENRDIAADYPDTGLDLDLVILGLARKTARRMTLAISQLSLRFQELKLREE